MKYLAFLFILLFSTIDVLAVGYESIPLNTQSSSSTSLVVDNPSKICGPIIGVTFRLYRRSRNCLNGVGICELSGVLFGWEWEIVGRQAAPATITVVEDNIHIEFLAPIDFEGEEPIITIGEGDEFTISGATAIGLGYTSIDLLKGGYPINFSNNSNGSVDIKVTTHE